SDLKRFGGCRYLFAGDLGRCVPSQGLLCQAFRGSAVLASQTGLGEEGAVALELFILFSVARLAEGSELLGRLRLVEFVASPAEGILVDVNEAALMLESLGFVRGKQQVAEPLRHALVLGDQAVLAHGEVALPACCVLDGV